MNQMLGLRIRCSQQPHSLQRAECLWPFHEFPRRPLSGRKRGYAKLGNRTRQENLGPRAQREVQPEYRGEPTYPWVSEQVPGLATGHSSKPLNCGIGIPIPTSPPSVHPASGQTLQNTVLHISPCLETFSSAILQKVTGHLLYTPSTVQGALGMQR